MPQQQEESPFWTNGTAQSELPQQPGLSPAGRMSGYVCRWDGPPLGERLPNYRPGPVFGLGATNSAAGSDASSLVEPLRQFPNADAAPSSLSPVLRYRPVPSLVEGSASGDGLFHAPAWSYSSPASPAPLSEEGLQGYHRQRAMTAPEILGYGPGLFHAPEAHYSPLPSPAGGYSRDIGHGDWSPESYGQIEARVEMRLGLYGPWPADFYNVDLYNGDQGGHYSGWSSPSTSWHPSSTPPLRPREPEPGVPILRQNCEMGNAMSRSCSRSCPRWLSTTCDRCGAELEPYEVPEEDPEDLEDLCTCDLHRQMRGGY